MALVHQVINFKSTIKYHRIHKYLRYYKVLFGLLFLKYFRNKNIKIIILTEHIGDIIAFTPFAEKLRSENPNNFIVWIVKNSYSSIIQFNHNIDQILATDCDGFVEIISKSPFKIYDVRFTGNNFCHYCITKKVFNKIDFNFDLDNYYEYGSLLEIFSKLAGEPMKKEDWKPTIEIPQKIENEVSQLNIPKNYLIIHSQSNDPNREWKIEKWKQLIEYLIIKYTYTIVLIGTKNTLIYKDNRFIDMCGKLSLLQTAALVKKAQFYIGIDSGPAHIANAMNTKSVILLGKYRNIINYMPFSGNFANNIDSKIIYDPSLKCREIEVETVINEFQLLLNPND